MCTCDSSLGAAPARVEEKLRSEETDPLRTAVADALDLVGDFQIRFERQPVTVGGARRPIAQFQECAVARQRRLRPRPPLREYVLRRIDRNLAERAVDRQHLPRCNHARRAAEPDHRRNPQGPDQDHRVVRRAADVAHETADPAPVELRGNRRRKLVGHQHQRRLQFVNEVDQRIAAGPQVALQAPSDVGKIAASFAEPTVTLDRETLVQLGNRTLEGPIGINALGANELVRAACEQRVVEHEQLCGKDRGLRRTDRPRHARRNLLELETRALAGRPEPLPFAVDAARGEPVSDLPRLAHGHQRAPHRDTGRNSPSHQARHGSSNPRTARPASASTA